MNDMGWALTPPEDLADQPQPARCDWCALVGRVVCPGVAVHCLAGDHCTTTTEVCALDAAQDDHPRTCCDCGADRG